MPLGTVRIHERRQQPRPLADLPGGGMGGRQHPVAEIPVEAPVVPGIADRRRHVPGEDDAGGCRAPWQLLARSWYRHCRGC